ncbi:hypothetical protein PYCCODRAFT_1439791 [Trametes coccinea BRFM310]|uniref:Uncharacterized protein n=1 Tax=Trametes coccinea (strain BRFM310) TaxID=1353009 RepID=A0A1Y2IDK4_TRAC3|nr:hypothetical protein PYCCODRAFT_1439791 [Trametes coccinea BRFM310]
MPPPNPEESEVLVLPSQVHPSYPYGDPLSIKHPASLPRRPYDPASRALSEGLGYGGGCVNGSLRLKDLALYLLFPGPVDQAREEAERAAQMRKMASGTTFNYPPLQAPPEQSVDEEEEIENGETDRDEDEEGVSEDEAEGESVLDGDDE